MFREYLANLVQAAKHPLAGQSVLVAASNYVTAALGFLTAVICARLLGPADYGLAALAIAYPSLIWSLCAVKTESVTIRYLSQFRVAGNSDMVRSLCKFGYSVDLVSSLVAFGIVGTTAWWVADAVYRHSELAWLMVAYGLSLPLRALAGTSIAVFSAWERFQWTALGHLLDKLGTLVCVAGFLLAGFGIAGMVLGTAFMQAAVGGGLALGANAFLVRAGLGNWWKSSLKGITSLKQELGGFLGWSYLTTTLNGLAEQIPLILLGRLRGPEEAGFFRLAISLVTVASYVEGALGRVTYPRLSARWTFSGGDGYRGTLLRWTAWGGVPAALGLVAIIPVLPVLVPLVFGDKYEAMVTGIQIMLGAATVGTLFFWLSAAYYVVGRFGSWAQGYAVYAAGVLGLSWWAVSGWGFTGMAVVSGVMKAMFTLAMARLILTPERANHETVPVARAGRG